MSSMSIRIKRLGDVVIALDNSINCIEGEEFLKGMNFLFLKEGKDVRLMIDKLDQFVLFQDKLWTVVTREISHSEGEKIDVTRDNDIVIVTMVNEKFRFTININTKVVKVERSFT